MANQPLGPGPTVTYPTVLNKEALLSFTAPAPAATGDLLTEGVAIGAVTPIPEIVATLLQIGTGGSIVPSSGNKAADIGAITDSTGGTKSTTFAAIAAGSSYAQADIVAIKNAIAQIAFDLNALRTALRNLGMMA